MVTGIFQFFMDVHVNKHDVIWSYLGIIMSFAASVITLPVVIYFLDSESLGLWYVFASIGSVTILFDFGFTVTFARNITYCWSGASKLKKVGTTVAISTDPDYRLMKDILFTCKRIYLIISVIALILLSTIGTGYIIYVSKTIPGNSHVIAWLIYVFAAFLNLYYNYFDSFLRGVGAVKQANQNRVYARGVQLLAMLFFLLMGWGILGLAIAYLIFGIVFRYLGKYYFYQYRGIGDKLKTIKETTENSVIKDLFKTVWYNAWRDGVVSISIYLSGQVSVILCSLYLSLTETGIYSIGLQIANVVGSLASTLYVTYQPALQSNWIKNNLHEVRKIMSTILNVYILSFIVGVIGVIMVGLPLLKLVKPDVIIGVPLMLGIFLSQFFLRYRDCYTSYFSCTNRLIYMPAFIISSVCCVVLSLVFLHFFDYNIWGLIVAQIVSQCLFNVWYWPLKAHRELHLNPLDVILIGTRNLKFKV